MDVDRHLEWLELKATALGDAADGVDPDVPVGIVPDWSLRESLRHIGGIHRWAATMVREARTERWDTTLLEVVGGAWPDDEELVDWYRDGHAALVAAIRDADPALEGWAFLPAPSTRRVLGPAAGARDRDPPRRRPELHRGGHRVRRGVRGRRRRRGALRVRAAAQRPARGPAGAAAGGDRRRTACWTARLGPELVDARDRRRGRGHAGGRLHRRAPASDLYLLIWNRRHAATDEVSGDPSVLDVWRGAVRVRWSE